jgi:hypothetical protein
MAIWLLRAYTDACVPRRLKSSDTVGAANSPRAPQIEICG